MAGDRDFYDILGVSRTASEDEIRRAYRRLARKHHPDVNQSQDAEKRFAEVSEAYETLSDAEKRKTYDRYGRGGVNQGAGFGRGGGPHVQWNTAGGGFGGEGGFGGGGGGQDMGDIFEQMFGQQGGSPFGGSGQRGAAPRPRSIRGRNVNQTISISFLTSVRGGTESVRSMSALGDSPDHSLEVTIPAGIEPGAKLRLRGKGDPAVGSGPVGSGSGGGGPAGDLILTIEVGSHPYFRREGVNILMDVPLSLSEAGLGTTVTVPLLSGTAEIRIPPGTSSGQRLRVKGQGIQGGKGRVGDFLAVVQIVAPEKLTESGRNLLETLAKELKNPRKSPPWTDSEE